MCAPGIFGAQMVQLASVKHVDQELPVLTIKHLRDSYFLVAYINGLLEVLNFDDPAEEPLYRFQIPNQDNHPNDEPLAQYEPFFQTALQSW